VIIGPWRPGDDPCGLILWVHRRLNGYVKADPKMDQPIIVSYLALKGISARAIHRNLTATLWRDPVACSSLTRYPRQARFLPSGQDAASASADRAIDDTDRALLSALDQNPFPEKYTDPTAIAVIFEDMRCNVDAQEKLQERGMTWTMTTITTKWRIPRTAQCRRRAAHGLTDSH
jgi:hypothetical protein